MAYLLVLAGIALLYYGGEALVSGSVRLARILGLSPLVIGLTVVAFGTSAPELAACLTATANGAPDLALGNVVGSNLANLGLILALAAVIRPIAVPRRFLKREIPFMLGTSAVLVPLVWGGQVVRLEGLLLLALLVPYLWVLLRSDSTPLDLQEELAREEGDGDGGGADDRLLPNIAKVVLGIFFLVLGSDFLVDGATTIALELGISERVIGLTMVAAGTSLPELASALIAALRRESDIVLGNVVGSNIFNVLAILGTNALVLPLDLDTRGVWLDLTVMLGLSLLCWPLLATGRRLVRWEGVLLLALYGGYVISLFVR